MRVITVCVLFLALSNSVYADLSSDITVVNSFQCPEADQILGIFDHESLGVLMFTDSLSDNLFFYDYTGFYIGQFLLDYEVPSPFGCVYSEGTDWYYINDFLDSDLNVLAGGTWYTFANPTSSHGRGMDWVNNYIWETYSDSRIYSFTDGLGNVEYFNTPEVHDTMSGLTLFLFDGHSYAMVTCYDPPHRFYFYRVSDGEYNGYEEIPFSVTLALGLAYVDSRDTFFFSCIIGDEYYIYELDFNFYYTSIQSTSLGSIKALFE